jgi:hypothetical protein
MTIAMIHWFIIICSKYFEKTTFSIPKVVGSIPTMAKHIFQACPVWIYTQSNITNNIWKSCQSFHTILKFFQRKKNYHNFCFISIIIYQLKINISYRNRNNLNSAHWLSDTALKSLWRTEIRTEDQIKIFLGIINGNAHNFTINFPH